MNLLEKLKAAKQAAIEKKSGNGRANYENRRIVKRGTMTSEVDGKTYTSKGVSKSKLSGDSMTRKTVVKLKGKKYDNPILKSKTVEIETAPGVLKSSKTITKFKKGYVVKDNPTLKTKASEMLPTSGKATLQKSVKKSSPKNMPTVGMKGEMGQTPMRRKIMLAKEKVIAPQGRLTKSYKTLSKVKKS